MREIPVRELQLMKLQLLKIIDDICRKEGIRYFLAYGTLIGAVREKGFVPWDQDIDLIMLREDYDLFNRVANEYLCQDKYFLQNYATEKNMLAPITRICIKGTYRASEALSHLEYEKGTFVDIFPVDYTSRSCYQKQYKKCRALFHRILFKESKPLSASKWKRLAKNALIFISKVVSTKTLKARLVKTMVQNEKTKELLVDFAGEYGAERESFDPQWFSDVVYLDFEDASFPCPIGYDAILTKIYGNYMVRPEADKIKPDLPSYYLA